MLTAAKAEVAQFSCGSLTCPFVHRNTVCALTYDKLISLFVTAVLPVLSRLREWVWGKEPNYLDLGRLLELESTPKVGLNCDVLRRVLDSHAQDFSCVPDPARVVKEASADSHHIRLLFL